MGNNYSTNCIIEKYKITGQFYERKPPLGNQAGQVTVYCDANARNPRARCPDLSECPPSGFVLVELLDPNLLDPNHLDPNQVRLEV